VKSVEITLNSDNTADLPADMVDWCKIGYATGQYITVMGQNDGLSREVQSGTSSEEANSNVSCYFSNLVNDHGELTGRIYGLGNGNPLSFKVIQERDVIQFDQRLNKGKIILEYITDGMSVTASTLVHLYAAQAIEDYIMWKYKQNNRAYNRFDVNLARTEYYDQVRRLRARLNPITATDIVRSSRSAFKLSIKP
jgi:hypothetical protein